MSRHPRLTAAGRPNRRHQQSRRADRRARLAFLLLAGLLVGIGATGAYAAKQREGAPTVTYSAIGVGAGECDSRPDAEERLIIEHGTWLNLVNHTGASATVDTGRQQAIAIADGSGVAVKLAVGVHTISLVPDCGSGVALAATIEVVNAREMPEALESPSGAPPVEPAGQATDPSGTSGPAPPDDSGNAAPGASADTATDGRVSGLSANETGGEGLGGEGLGGEGLGGATGGTRGSSTALAGGPLVDDIEGVVAIGVLGGEIEGLLLGRGPKDQGANLLAVIAAICVLGVTAAIIRAILTQRASRTLRA